MGMDINGEGDWNYTPLFPNFWSDGPSSYYEPDLYTPNVIRNLKDKPQPFRTDRIYLREVKRYDREHGSWEVIVSPGTIDEFPRLPQDARWDRKTHIENTWNHQQHYAPDTLATGGVLKQCVARNCHNVVKADETLCKYHRGGLRAGYPIAILSSR